MAKTNTERAIMDARKLYEQTSDILKILNMTCILVSTLPH